MRPRTMSEIIGGKRYNTETATLIAGNDYWDGHNYERSNRNTFLYRTPKGSYFSVFQTQWQGERDSLQVLTQDEAIGMWEQLSERQCSFEQAFPGVKVEEA